jgi:cellobiose phosphorylase
VKTGEVPFEGGWRVYSSGAGIAVRLIRECWLGIRKATSLLVVDPVTPPRLDGLCADIELAGKRVKVVYRIAAVGCGPTRLTLNGSELPFRRETHPYRSGGAVVSVAALSTLLTDGVNTLQVQLQ